MLYLTSYCGCGTVRSTATTAAGTRVHAELRIDHEMNEGGTAMAVFARILQLLAKYGARAVEWAKAHVQQILNWINAGQAIDWIVAKIKQILGIR